MADPAYQSTTPRSTVPPADVAPRSAAMNTVLGIALALTIIGGINWGLVGLFRFDLVAAIFGEMSAMARLVYILVGVAALISLGCYSRLNRTSFR